jgi:ankyrin repeat protein
MSDNLQGAFNGAARMPLTGHLENQLHKLAASKTADITLLQQLINEGVNLEHQNEKGQTPFFVACRDNNTPMIKALADAGAKLDVTDLNGATPLFMAVAHYNEDAVQAMMDKGLHPDHARYNGMTALMHAANFNKPDIVRELMEHGADHKLKSDDRGFTAAQFAEDNLKKHLADKIGQWAEERSMRDARKKLEAEAHAAHVARESEKALMDALQNQGMPTGHAISVKRPVKIKRPAVLQ